ncbi:Iron-containing alcohol dehydrogenase [Vibrio nigripulchritudo SOn1]|uniref:Iron-containing alcohol dehydrogenase n=1 Tax=Vibrio nigripulchritudo SOn1 TaxID=1238450 RepID=A0AAV2W0I9_9VIBR|nr:iron-containing alcohol dehydrogenase [Vibrio nigripulchritudo]CCO50298.1 Iron-containing alcohol dehydrogenase [Vibrio nigripulchritudo SOn1]
MNKLRPITIHQAATLEIGSNTLSKAVEFVGERSVLVVTTPPVAHHANSLGIQRNIKIFADTPAEPDDKALNRLLDIAEKFQPEVVIGLGGGSAMDLAKLTAVLWDRQQNIEQVVGSNQVAKKLSTLIQIPTTSGTGSETGIRALVTQSDTGEKMAVESAFMRADVVILDPTLTFSVPSAITAATGIDALAHCVESFTNVNSHPVIDEYARLGIKLVGKYLNRAVLDGNDVEAREAMMVASYYGGICLGPVNTAAGHAIAYPLSTTLHLPHGLANAIIFPHVLSFNFDACPEKSLEISKSLGFSNVSTAKDLFNAAFAYCQELGIDMSLEKYGTKKAQLLEMSQNAFSIRRLMDNNPKHMSMEDILSIYNAAY